MSSTDAADARHHHHRRHPSSADNSPTAFLSRGGIGQNELDQLHAAVSADLRGAGGRRSLPQPPSSPADGGGGGDLLAAMAKRLAASERNARALREALVAQEKEALALRAEAAAAAGAAAAPAAAETEEELAVLRTQNAELSLQVVEMTRFLADNGYGWVGSGRAPPLVGGGEVAGGGGDDGPTVRFGGSGHVLGRGGGDRQQTQKQPTTATVATATPGPPSSSSSFLYGGDDGPSDGGFVWGASHGTAAAAASPSPSAKAKAKDKAAASSVVAQEKGSASPSSSPLPFPLPRFLERVAELNAQVSAEKVVAEEGRLADGRAVRVLRDPESVEVVLYEDGICVQRGVFRPYGWPLCTAFIDDVLDGYFPCEYRERYPNGVVLRVVDKTGVGHLEDAAAAAAAARGGCGDTGAAACCAPLGRAAFLRRVPAQRITAAGKIVDVRAGVASAFGVVGGEEAAAKVEKVEDLRSGGEEGGVVVELRIRVVGTAGTVVGRFDGGARVGDVKEAVRQRWLPRRHAGRAFELVAAAERRVLGDEGATLEEAGLGPRGAAVVMRLLPEGAEVGWGGEVSVRAVAGAVEAGKARGRGRVARTGVE